MFLGLQGAFSALLGSAAAATARSALPIAELSRLHEFFGGDASVWDNRPLPQQARSGGTISALSVQIPALEKLAPFLQGPGVTALDLGFGSGVMVAMLLAVAGEGAKVIGVDLADKVPVATRNLLGDPGGSTCPHVPFKEESFSLVAGDAFERLMAWENEGRLFDVVYSGCSMDPGTDQLRLFLGRLKPAGAAVFNLGTPGQQGMYLVAEGGRVCEQLMRVNFMMCESPMTPRTAGPPVPLGPDQLCEWVRTTVWPGGSGDL